MAPATVLYLHSSSGRYGADRQLQLIASGLDPARYRPLVVLPESGPLASDLQAGGIEVLVHELSVLRRADFSPRGLTRLGARAARDVSWLTRLIIRRRPTLVHSNTSVVLGGAAAAMATGRPHVWHVREIYTRFSRWWPAYRRLLLTAAALPCVSRATAAQFGQAGQRLRVIHDGLAQEPHRTPRLEAREALGLDPEAPVIAVLGRISDWKGQDVLVRALAEPELQRRAAVGLIAGDVWPGGEDRVSRVRTLAAALGVSDRLCLLGFRDDVENILGAADLVAVPSTAPDPLPGSAIEAAAAGCAVVAAAHGGLPEIIHDGETGCLVRPGDPASLARTAAQLIDDPARRERLGSAAAEDVRRRFSAEQLLAAIQGLYDHVRGPRAT